MKLKTSRDKERGATLVESAIVFGVLFLTLFAVVEFGLAFKDWLSVSHASREGARAGATFGQDPAADILILREVEDVMAPTGFPVGSQVEIYNASASGTWAGVGTTYSYAPGTGCGSAVSPPLPGCCDWTPCPEPGRLPGTYVAPTWPTNQRDVEAPNTDRLGVEVTFTHNWVTNLFDDTSDFTTSTEFQMEPEVFAP